MSSRFQWGLIADIQPPAEETRLAILEKKAREQNVPLPPDVARLLAGKAPNNIRELEGLLNRVVAYSRLINTRINLTVANAALAAMTPAVVDAERAGGDPAGRVDVLRHPHRSPHGKEPRQAHCGSPARSNVSPAGGRRPGTEAGRSDPGSPRPLARLSTAVRRSRRLCCTDPRLATQLVGNPGACRPLTESVVNIRQPPAHRNQQRSLAVPCRGPLFHARLIRQLE